MFSYRKKIVFVSISLHIIGLCGVLFYWIFYSKPQTPQTQASAPNTQKVKRDIPDTGKKPYEKYDQGDLKNEQISRVLIDSIDVEEVNTEDKVKELDTKFNQLSRTSTKEVEKMARIVAESTGAVINTSSKPDTEYSANSKIDIDSIKLQDFELTPKNEYILIFKDKNNIFIKDGPHKYEDIDESLRVRLDLVRKAKENKKMRILLNVTDSIMDSLFMPSKNETTTDKNKKQETQKSLK